MTRSRTGRTRRITPTRGLVSAALVVAVTGVGTQFAVGGRADVAREHAPGTGGAGADGFQALYDEVAGLSGEDALAFFQSLPDKGVTGMDVIDFFIDLPLSQANEQIYDLYQEEGFDDYISHYPRGEPFEGFQWEHGIGHARSSGPSASST